MENLNLNTSHVNVNLEGNEVQDFAISLFKYISC